MSVADNIQRIQEARNQIRDHLVGLGLANGDETIDELAVIVEGLDGSGIDNGFIFDKVSITPPIKSEYEVGESLDLTGYSVSAEYKKDVTLEATTNLQDGMVFDTTANVNLTASYTSSGETKTGTVVIRVHNQKPYIRVIQSNVPEIIEFDDLSEFLKVMTVNSGNVTANGVTFMRSSIKEAHLCNRFTSLPEGFCNSLTGLSILSGLGSVETVGSNFSCVGTLDELPDFSNNLISIGDNFKMLRPPDGVVWTIPDSVETIGDNFGVGDSNSNGAVRFSEQSRLQSIGSYFSAKEIMFECKNLKSIGDRFMHNLSAYYNNNDSPLVLPDGLENIGSYFLYNCAKFNSELILPPTLKTIGDNFMCGCTIFNNPLTFGSGITQIAAPYFMATCNNMVGPIEFNCPASVITGASGYTLVVSPSSIAYTSGIQITGEYAEEIKAKLPDITSGTLRRRLIIAQ